MAISEDSNDLPLSRFGKAGLLTPRRLAAFFNGTAAGMTCSLMKYPGCSDYLDSRSTTGIYSVTGNVCAV